MHQRFLILGAMLIALSGCLTNDGSDTETPEQSQSELSQFPSSNCDDSGIVCEVPVPSCPSGYTPGVNSYGTCYTGACVPIFTCACDPSDFEDCPTGYVCAKGPWGPHCVRP